MAKIVIVTYVIFAAQVKFTTLSYSSLWPKITKSKKHTEDLKYHRI